MTLVAIWYNSERSNDEQIWAAADTSISNVETTLQGHEFHTTLTEFGSKVLELPVVCKLLPNITQEVYFRTSLGFAFAGSSLVGLNCYSTLASLLSSLGSPQKIKAIPDYKSILKKATEILSLYSASVRGLAETAIYGFCPQSNEPFIAKISATLVDDKYVYTAQEHLITENLSCCCLGSETGNKRLLELIDMETATTSKINRFKYWRIPAVALNSIVQSNLFPTIGGGLQFGVAGRGYYEYLHNVVRIDGEPRAVHRNIDLSYEGIPTIGDCRIAINGLIL
ncbi:hypothetical protein [Mucilaginibacter sp. L3T2-6]|uniref:hypothetical protein n=1 Tax=Mucilaginibacter sp. L3T2-6 TaxID=3062491 RepID=UPI0026751D98|nr:hypothetical protein [Mucilaginibacter sp. L3T2-6]MDO3643848.1 hypothetical protein [Mucilaginibacter sp. L3T2-6]MDV6216299.1 hypothetical protein [Mucilaginibacter sp. L3T2-6]